MEDSKQINDDAEYAYVMGEIDGLMAKGSANVSLEELEEIRHLALAAQRYEHQKYAISPPNFPLL